MTEPMHPEIEFEHDDFDLATIEDEIRVDESCQSLLKRFYQDLQVCGYTAQRASDLAYSADFYLRDYLLDFARQNVVRPQPGIVRRFAATWFITRTLDPEISALERHLEGIRELYRYLHRQHLISADELAFIEAEADQTEYYRQRIESFLAISGDGYIAWEEQCPLRG
ncbi:MAG: hypothetical protein HYV06_07500 [Deltaproteobacteria bacterium]|nr:hypothetical protein [Deltaproteobacteria bacterium]